MNDDTLFDILETLSNTIGMAGNETEVRRTLRPLVEDHVDEMHVDPLGNLITLKRGAGEVPLRVLVTAHMDEVGLMVMGHRSDGGLRVGTIGSINARILPGTKVLVGEDRIPGVIGLKAIHHTKPDQRKEAPSIESIVVDVGATSKDAAESLAPVGTTIAFATRFSRVGDSLMGKAFDDRGGCTILTALLQSEPYPFDLYGVFTVQEEVGLRGAKVAAYAVDPDVGIALENTIADDMPKGEDEDVSPTTELDKGAALTVMDRSYVAHPPLLRHFTQTGDAEGIPYQIKQPGISGTEAGALHKVRAGVPALTVAIPCRYIHGPVALMRPEDLKNTLRLVEASLRRLTPDVVRH